MRVPKGMRIINRQFDALVVKSVKHSERVANYKLQCRKGCNYCCNLLVTATLSEAVAISDKYGLDQLQLLIPSLAADAKALADPSMTVDRWSQAWKPCHLLRDGLCSVYETRPLSCRSHVSFSAPKLCDDPNGKVLMLEAARHLNVAVTKHLQDCGMPASLAPLQYQLLLVLYFEMHPNGQEEFDRLQKTAAIDLALSCVAWKHLVDEPLAPEILANMPDHVEIFPVWEFFARAEDGSVAVD